MRIGVIGGTGGMGKGFAMRWARNHHILIGSRDAARAADAAASYRREADAAYGGGWTSAITGGDNRTVAAESDVLILSIPYGGIDSTCAETLPHIGGDCIVVSPIVPMKRTGAGFEFIPMTDRAARTSHESVAAHMGGGSGRLVSAFHVISEKKLADPGIALDCDIFVCGDDKGAVDAVCSLVSEIGGLRPVRLGPGRLAYMAEIATPLLLNAMIRNGQIRNPGIKLV